MHSYGKTNTLNSGFAYWQTAVLQHPSWHPQISFSLLEAHVHVLFPEENIVNLDSQLLKSNNDGHMINTSEMVLLQICTNSFPKSYPIYSLTNLGFIRFSGPILANMLVIVHRWCYHDKFRFTHSIRRSSFLSSQVKIWVDWAEQHIILNWHDLTCKDTLIS